MNESEFESTLRTLRPAAPSRNLEEAIARDLAESCVVAEPRRERPRVASEEKPSWLALWLDRLLWSGAGAAAALLVLLLTQPKPHDAGPSQDIARATPSQAPVATLDASSLQPVLASEEDLGWHEEGVRFDAHGQPLLKLRRTAVERKAWADPQNAGIIQMEKPRQEVMWVPVSMH